MLALAPPLAGLAVVNNRGFSSLAVFRQSLQTSPPIPPRPRGMGWYCRAISHGHLLVTALAPPNG